MKKEFVRKTIILGLVVLLGTVLTISYSPTVTGFTIFDGDGIKQAGAVLLIGAAIMVLFIITNRGKVREVLKSMLGAAVILLGIYAATELVPNTEILIAALSLTFGIMALIWIWKAKNAFSSGSQLRDFTGSLLSCLVAILIFSLYENFTAVFGLQGQWAYGKYALITVAYINFVYTAYKMRNLGKVFGFSEQSARIKKAIKSRS